MHVFQNPITYSDILKCIHEAIHVLCGTNPAMYLCCGVSMVRKLLVIQLGTYIVTLIGSVTFKTEYTLLMLISLRRSFKFTKLTLLVQTFKVNNCGCIFDHVYRVYHVMYLLLEVFVGNTAIVCIYIASSLDAMKDLVAESAIMKTFHHPNVLPLLGVCIDYDDEDVLKIVIPFMANGDLKTFLKDSRVSSNNTHDLPEVSNTTLSVQ